MDLDSAFEMAKKIELEGKEFYERAESMAKNRFVAQVFSTLAKEEEAHIRAIERIYGELKEKGKLNEWVVTTQDEVKPYIFTPEKIEEVKDAKDDVEALKFALELEEKSISFYESMAKESQDSKLKRFFLTLSYEERGHYLRIVDSIEFLVDPQSLLMKMERSMRDGG